MWFKKKEKEITPTAIEMKTKANKYHEKRVSEMKQDILTHINEKADKGYYATYVSFNRAIMSYQETADWLRSLGFRAGCLTGEKLYVSWRSSQEENE